jgi:putative flippase GtrA
MNSKNLSNRERLRELFRFKAVRFIIAGLVNTGSTYLLYLLLLFCLDYRVAYAISYVAGIFLAFALNSRLVFKVKFNLLRMALYPVIYVFQYLANAWLLDLFVGKLHIAKQAAPLLAICITLPVVYVLNKIILTKSPRKPTGIQ